MLSLISLILLLFNILAAFFIFVMAGLLILLLLVIFIIVAVFVGLKEKSILKGLRVLFLASSILIITPLISFLFRYKIDNVLNLNPDYQLLAGIIFGLVISSLFAVCTISIFEKFARNSYKYITKKGD